MEYHHIFKQTLLEFISSYGSVQGSLNKHSLARGNKSVFVTNDVCIILTLLILGIWGGCCKQSSSTTAHLPCILNRKPLSSVDVRNTVRYTRGHVQGLQPHSLVVRKPHSSSSDLYLFIVGGKSPLATTFFSDLHLCHAVSVVPCQEVL